MQSKLQQNVLVIEHGILQMGFNGFMGTSVGAPIWPTVEFILNVLHKFT